MKISSGVFLLKKKNLNGNIVISQFRGETLINLIEAIYRKSDKILYKVKKRTLRRRKTDD